MRYHLNGILVFISGGGLWFLLGITDLVPYDYLYHYRWYGLAGACMLGMVVTVWCWFCP